MKSITRRQFVASTAAAIAAPTILIPGRTRAANLLGHGAYQYEFIHEWARLPDKYTWQTTHNVAVDSHGQVYVIHEGRENLADHPAIFVFDHEGKFVRAFGSQFQGGGHGLEVRDEGGEEFLYVAAYQQVKTIAKLTMSGETVWERYAPMDSGVYAANEDTDRKKVWGRDRFMPTNFAFLDDGDFFLADGYGSFFIHRYDKDGNWKNHFAGPGAGQGKFNTPHGLWIDRRGLAPTLIVTDRANHRLQVLSTAGEHLKTVDGFGLPANCDIQGDLLLVPELLGRVSLYDKSFSRVALLGDDRTRIENDKKFEIRRDQSQWQNQKFVHPHDACFDQQGNILVAEWVADGRVSMLKKIG